MQDHLDRLEWFKPKMDELFQKKAQLESGGRDFSMDIQNRRDYRNPSIGEKLIEHCKIKEQYGTNLPRECFDPDSWKKKPEAHYDSSMYRKLVEEREREKRIHRSDHHNHLHQSTHSSHHDHRDHSSSSSRKRRIQHS